MANPSVDRETRLELIQAYRRGFNSSGQVANESDDQITQKLQEQNIKDPAKAGELGKTFGDQQAGR